MEVLPRFFDSPTGSFFLIGPRGTGKSSWLRAHYPDALWLDLLDPETHRLLSARPERLRELVAADSGPRRVVIDEVQRAPELLPVVHSVIEQRRNVSFALTGSSARKLKRTGVDLLAGRAVLRSLHPFMAAELGTHFDLTSALRHGTLPLVVAAPAPADVLRTYAALYLREEVQSEGLVRNIGVFARFLEAVSFSHAATLNVSKVAADCQVERKTVEAYIGVLEDLLLAFRLPVFTRRAKRVVVAHPKLYLFDAGVYRSVRPAGPLDRPAEIDGAALEGLVAQHLRAWIAYRNDDHQLYFWRTRSGVEVDFVVYGETGIWAIEVKNTARIRPEDLRGLAAFQEDYPEATCLLVYRGTEHSLHGATLAVPVEDLLRELRPDRLLWARHPRKGGGGRRGKRT